MNRIFMQVEESVDEGAPKDKGRRPIKPLPDAPEKRRPFVRKPNTESKRWKHGVL